MKHMPHLSAGSPARRQYSASFAEELGLDKETAYKIACGFGSGLSRTDNICGAVSGAIMVIGLKYGKVTPKDNAARDKTQMLVQQFLREFAKEEQFSQLHRPAGI